MQSIKSKNYIDNMTKRGRRHRKRGTGKSLMNSNSSNIHILQIKNKPNKNSNISHSKIKYMCKTWDEELHNKI